MLFNFKPTSRNRWDVRVNGRKVGTIAKRRGVFVAALPRHVSAVILGGVSAFMTTMAKR